MYLFFQSWTEWEDVNIIFQYLLLREHFVNFHRKTMPIGPAIIPSIFYILLCYFF